MSDLPRVRVSGVGEEDHVNLISELGHGGQDEHHRGQNNNSHRGECVQLKNMILGKIFRLHFVNWILHCIV